MGQELDVKTTSEQFEILPKGIIWKNVKGNHHVDNNSNAQEIEKAVIIAIELAEKHPNLTIGITNTIFLIKLKLFKMRYLKNI